MQFRRRKIWRAMLSKTMEYHHADSADIFRQRACYCINLPIDSIFLAHMPFAARRNSAFLFLIIRPTDLG